MATTDPTRTPQSVRRSAAYGEEGVMGGVDSGLGWVGHFQIVQADHRRRRAPDPAAGYEALLQLLVAGLR